MGKKAWAGALAVALVVWAGAAPAIEVSVAVEDLGVLGSITTIALSGTIEPGDADRLAQQLSAIPFGPGSMAQVLLDSPGGSLMDGMGIGRVLAGLPTVVTTDVGRPDGRPADCASACVLAFMGGHYRSLREGSRLGVHQFYATDELDLTGAEALSIGQVLSAEIVGYLAEMRVDPAFYRRMTEPEPEEIGWVPLADLESFGVVTDEVRSQRTEYRNADGNFYLTLWQEGLYGENKIMLSCNELGGVVFMAFLQPPDTADVEARPHDFAVTIDGVPEPPLMWDYVGTDGRWAISLFSLDEEQMARLDRAARFGARMMPPEEGVFFGFDYRIEGSHIRDMVEGCASQAGTGASQPDLPTQPEPASGASAEPLPEGAPVDAPTRAGAQSVPASRQPNPR